MSWLYVLRCRAVWDTNNCDKFPVVGLQELFTIATWSTSVVNLFFASRIFARNSTRCMTSERLRLVKESNWTVCEWTSAEAANFVISLIRMGAMNLNCMCECQDYARIKVQIWRLSRGFNSARSRRHRGLGMWTKTSFAYDALCFVCTRAHTPNTSFFHFSLPKMMMQNRLARMGQLKISIRRISPQRLDR